MDKAKAELLALQQNASKNLSEKDATLRMIRELGERSKDQIEQLEIERQDAQNELNDVNNRLFDLDFKIVNTDNLIQSLLVLCTMNVGVVFFDALFPGRVPPKDPKLQPLYQYFLDQCQGGKNQTELQSTIADTRIFNDEQRDNLLKTDKGLNDEGQRIVETALEDMTDDEKNEQAGIINQKIQSIATMFKISPVQALLRIKSYALAKVSTQKSFHQDEPMR